MRIPPDNQNSTRPNKKQTFILIYNQAPVVPLSGWIILIHTLLCEWIEIQSYWGTGKWGKKKKIIRKIILNWDLLLNINMESLSWLFLSVIVLMKWLHWKYLVDIPYCGAKQIINVHLEIVCNIAYVTSYIYLAARNCGVIAWKFKLPLQSTAHQFRTIIRNAVFADRPLFLCYLL